LLIIGINERKVNMSGQKILIVEDELKIARFLELELEYEGYKVDKTHDGRTGLDKAVNGNFDLVILDIMLPMLNGIEVLRRLRLHSQVPVIVLTAKDEIMDKVTGLDMGADDYITKPFAIEELLARIRTSLRRKTEVVENSKILLIKGICLDADKYSVVYNSDDIELTKKEFSLLQYLMENKNLVLTREKIVEKVWGYDYVGDTNVVDVYIRYLRSKIDDVYDIKLISTVRGVGYVIKDA
jgi:two-component system response regulator ArlR